MALTIKHPFVSAVTDDAVAGEVGPSEWNDIHTVTGVSDPAGADKQVLFNNAGVMAGDPGLTYDFSTDTLSVGARVLAGLGTAALPAYSFTGALSSGFWSPSAGTIRYSSVGGDLAQIGGAGVSILSNMRFGWTSDQTITTVDTGLFRESAGVVQVASGTLNDYRDLKLRTLLAGNGNAATPSMSFASDPDTGFYWAGSGVLVYSANAVVKMGWAVNYFSLVSDYSIMWNNPAANAIDVGLSRAAANILEINTGTPGTPGDLKVRGINTTGNVNIAGTIYGASSLTLTGRAGMGSMTVAGSLGTIAAGTPGVSSLVYCDGAANAAYIGFLRSGIFGAHFGIDTDNQWKVGGWSYGAANSYKLLHEGNAFTIDGSGNLNTTRTVYTSKAVGGGYSYLALVNGALNFYNSQSYGVQVGSTITTLVAMAGQCCRIIVVGNGAITMPSSVKWATGSPTWGVGFTIISMWTHDGAQFWSSTTPFPA